MQSDFEDAEATAELEGVAFEHPLRDVRDAFGFAAGAAYQNWFYQNRRLLDLYRRLEEGGEFQGRGSLFTVNEDFVCQWENTIQPDGEHQSPHGYWSYHVREGWELDGYG